MPDFLGTETPLTLFAIALVPMAIMIAILRYQLLDVRLVAIADIRGLADELRPPVLDGRGLVGALQDYVDSVQTPGGPPIQVSTDGVADGKIRAPWTAGVGLSSMRQRVAALGSRISAGPSETGGEVRVSLPLAAS